MALNKIDIINTALSKLGSDRLQLTDAELTADELSSAKQANLHYIQAIDELTNAHTWNCCKHRVRLSPYEYKATIPSTAAHVDEQQVMLLRANGLNTDAMSTTGAMNRPSYYASNSNGVLNVSWSNNDDDTFTTRSDNTKGAWKFIWTASGQSAVTKFVASSDHELPSSVTMPIGASGADVKITLEKTLTHSTFGYKYSFAIPNYDARIYYITNTDDSTYYLRPNVEWVRERDSILTNYEKIWCCFLERPWTESRMTPPFVKCLYTLLAHKMCMSLTGDFKMSQKLLEEYEFVLADAKRIDGFEQNIPPSIDSEWLEATLISPSSQSNSWPPFSQQSYGNIG